MAKCACEPCVCDIKPEKAFSKDGKFFCNETCASGLNCGHEGCHCAIC